MFSVNLEKYLDSKINKGYFFSSHVQMMLTAGSIEVDV